MRRIYTTLLIGLTTLTVCAQHTFIQQGQNWHVIGFTPKSYVNFEHLTAPEYEIDYSFPENSDTLIGGVKYKRLVGINQNKVYDERCIRESEGKVFCYDHQNKREELLYDFTLHAGESFTLYPNTRHEMRCEVTSAGDSLYCGEQRRVICFDAYLKDDPSDPGTPNRWIEGIGYPRGPVEEAECDLYAGGSQQLTQFVTQEIPQTVDGETEKLRETIYASDFDTRYYYGRYYAGGKEREVDWDDPTTMDNEDAWKELQKDDLHYEIVNHRLHLYGYIYSPCCPEYLYLTVDENKEVHFRLTPLTDILPDCATQHEIDMYFPGFYEEGPYTIVDRSGGWHIVEDSWRPDEVVSIWKEGTAWEVYYEPDPDLADGPETYVIYRLLKADMENYLALEKTLVEDGQPGMPELQGYIRNDGDSLIYVRPIMKDGTIGEECLLYDFRCPYEYGQTIQYGVEGGEIKQEYIDWQKGVLEYYLIKGEGERCFPAWQGIVYRYGCLDGPMELFYKRSAPGKGTRPRPTNISHVIFSTKGGSQKAASKREQYEKSISIAEQEQAKAKSKVMAAGKAKGSQNTSIPYCEMLTDGTVWECLSVSADNPSNTHTYTVRIKGDALIGERSCKQVYSQEQDITLSMFEEGRKIYVIGAGNTPEVLLDFGLQEQEEFNEATSVTDIRMQYNQGYNYRTITIDTGQDSPSYFVGDTHPRLYSLIEGIGVSKDEYLHNSLSDGSTVSHLLRCWKNGHLVYQAPGSEAVSVKSILSGTTHTLYDLQGRKVSAPSLKGLYIKDGKKVLW